MESAPQYQSPRWAWIALTAILLLALLLRGNRIAKPSLWADEIFTLEQSTGRGLSAANFPRNVLIKPSVNNLLPTGLTAAPSWSSVPASLADDTHPPLHLVLLRVWRSIFGEPAEAARWLSVVASLVAIGFLYDATRLLFRPAVGLWAALLMALAGPQIEYAQEIRSYALLLATSLACCAMIARLELLGPSRRRWIALAVALLLAMLTHYNAAYPLGALALYIAIRFRGRLRTQTMVTFSVAAIAFLLVWGPMLYRQRGNFASNMAWTAHAEPKTKAQILFPALALPARFFFEPMKSAGALPSVAAILYLLPIFFLRREPRLLLWWLILIVTVGAVAMSDLIRSAWTMQLIRYTIVASPAVYAIAAAMIAHWRGWIAHAIPAVLALSCLFALPDAYTRWRYDYRELGAFVSDHAMPRDVLIFVDRPNEPWHAGVLYAAITHYAQRVPCAVAFIDRPINETVLAELKSSAGVVRVIGDSPEVSHRYLPEARLKFIRNFPFLGIMMSVDYSVEPTPATTSESPQSPGR